MSHRPTWAELRREVKAAGGVRQKQGSTSHIKWKMPSGAVVILQEKHLARVVPVGTLNNIRNILKAGQETED